MANEIDILKFTSDELTAEKLSELVKQRRSFQVVAVKDISYVVNKVEGEIEKQNLRCRVYTEYRTAAIAGVAVPTGITQLAGIATAIGVGLHNLATINPDYEIAKNKFAGAVTVMYQKE
ncbi:hypothetical protein [Stutzerimonas stutzeri]|uniref:hypothetical protein n=1 Tax=Stutzerimonas stutzeri TaxID=316 RepID=UPI002204E909|nr:hypothetical protein [Stutzerimonas stutzeri]UVO19122.1 hypothetical protein KN217_05265 [Stutzerimonas stutzeri]